MSAELSFEVFPPKTSDGIGKIYGCLDELATLNPSFISVTYSAGNAKKGLTAEVCGTIREKYGIKAVSHLTCAGATPESIAKELDTLKSLKVDTILALRGDVTPEKELGAYRHATDLIERINACGGFEVMAACYPEGHVESGSVYEDLFVMKAKYDLGVRKFISQLFMDNADFLHMRDAGKKTCKDAFFCAGIMPVLSAGSVYRMITLSGAKLTPEMRELLYRYGGEPASMKKAGIDYAIKQIRALCAEGCDEIHLYTMCRADVTKEIYNGIRDVL